MTKLLKQTPTNRPWWRSWVTNQYLDELYNVSLLFFFVKRHLLQTMMNEVNKKKCDVISRHRPSSDWWLGLRDITELQVNTLNFLIVKVTDIKEATESPISLLLK